ncbi:MAG: TrmB family transcriptional regulator [Candidatus Hermodarchaeota archaeon]
MSQEKYSEALEEFKKLLNDYKSASIPEANWRLHALLRRLGLTKYEAQAYILLIEGGGQEHNVTQIVKKTGIPHPRAYDTLRSLVKYGLITPKTKIDKPTSDKSKRTPITYKAFEPSIGIGNLFAFFTYAKNEAIKELQKLANFNTQFESGIWEVLGRENIINIIKLMIKEAKYEILIAADIPFIQKIRDSLISASKRNVSISCVSSFTEEINPTFLLETLNFLRIRHRKNFPMPYIILDRSHAIQWNFKIFTKQGYGDPEFTQAQVIDKVDLIDTLIDHFFFLNWRIGQPISMSQEISLPKTLIHSVTFVEELENLLSKNLKPKVVVKGYLINTGDPILKIGHVFKIYKDWESGVFTIYLKTDKGAEVSVGGFGAIYEDIAADQITIGL